MTERWRPVVGYEGRYEVSDQGRIRGRSGHVLATTVNDRGYARIVFRVAGRRVSHKVHHLVAEAWIGPRPLGAEINHRDGAKSNNAARNLEWTTRAGNMRHAVATGLVVLPRERRRKITDATVAAIRSAAATSTQRQIASRFGLSRAYVSELLAGKYRP